MIVQILNIFLGEKENQGIFGAIKSRFVAKWGWIWKK